MREKKCLGCGGIFEGRFAVCQQCIELINTVRQGAISIPGRLKKNNLEMTRKILLWLAILLIVMQLFLLGVVSSAMGFFIINNISYNRTMLFVYLYLPLISAIVLGVFSGRVFGRKSVKLFLAQWSNGDWYSRADRSPSNLKYWLINNLSYFFWVVLIFLFFILVRIYSPESFIKIGPVYSTLFNMGLFLGIRIFFPVLLIGYNLAFLVNTSWVKKVVK